MDHRDAQDPMRALDIGVDPPAALRARVSRTLVARGLLRPLGRAIVRGAGAAAAAAAIFVAGYVAGGVRPDALPAADGLARYALFLYEDDTFEATHPETDLIAEYSAWAVGLAEQGRLAAGEKLAAEGHLLDGRSDSIVVAPRGVTAAAGVLTGLFIIRAASEAEALAIARSCPHLKYGGRVDVRLIAET